MAGTSDWFDIRGWMESIVGWSMDQVHDLLPSSEFNLGPLGSINIQSEFASVQGALEIFIFTTIMCTVVFTTMMLTLMIVPYIERKFIARLMDRLGATTTLRSLWIGEGHTTAGRWWNQLPFGIGAPIGWINGLLNSTFGNKSKHVAVDRVHNRGYHGIWFLLPGLVQNVADGMKFLTKEWMVPSKADKFIFEIAPFIIITSTVMIFAFIPLSPNIYSANPELSLLFLMAIFGIAPFGVFFAGWSSNNKYTLLGGIRSAAQLTAYEIPLLITVLSVAVISGSLNIIEIVEFQISSGSWNLFLLPLGAGLFLITMVAEVERIPFDMPEAEAELVEGWWTEYGGMRWGLMFASEYLRCYAACLLFSLFFLGGWEMPFGDSISNIVPNQDLILASAGIGLIGLAIGITENLTKKYDAVQLAKIGSEIIGGKGGGGRPDFAQAGGTDSSKIDNAIDQIKSLI